MLDPRKDALIAFTASWCGFCRDFEPHWKAAVTAFKNVKDIQFKNLDVNDAPAALKSDPILRGAHELMRGYPTIVYYHSSSGMYSLYQKSRESSVLIPSIAQMIAAKPVKAAPAKPVKASKASKPAKLVGGGRKKSKK